MTHNFIQGGDARIGYFFYGLAGNQDVFQVGQTFEHAPDALVNLGVDDRGLDAHERQSVLQLLGSPPGVHRCRDRAGAQRCVEAKGPFGIVAHDDRDAVALHDAEIRHQRLGQRPRGQMQGAEGDALVFVDDVGPVGELGGGRFKDERDGGRRVLVDLHRNAADHGVLQLDRGARPCERCIGRRNRHHGPVRTRAFGHGHFPPDCLVLASKPCLEGPLKRPGAKFGRDRRCSAKQIGRRPPLAGQVRSAAFGFVSQLERRRALLAEVAEA